MSWQIDYIIQNLQQLKHEMKRLSASNLKRENDELIKQNQALKEMIKSQQERIEELELRVAQQGMRIGTLLKEGNA